MTVPAKNAGAALARAGTPAWAAPVVVGTLVLAARWQYGPDATRPAFVICLILTIPLWIGPIASGFGKALAAASSQKGSSLNYAEVKEPSIPTCMAPTCIEKASHRSFDGPWTWCLHHAGPGDVILAELERGNPERLTDPESEPPQALLDEPEADQDRGKTTGLVPVKPPEDPRPESCTAQVPLAQPIIAPFPAYLGVDLRERLASARARLEENRANNPYPRPEEFHFLARKYLVDRGYRIATARPYRDFDLDLVTSDPDGEKVLVRCRWQVETKRNHLGTLLREMAWIGADRAMMIACGWFGRKTRAWAEGQPIELVDGEEIGALQPLGATWRPEG